MKIVKWLGIGLGVVVALVAVALVGARTVSANKLAKKYEVHAFQVPELPTDPEALAEGGRLFHARGCAECHASDGGGKAVIDDPGLGKIYGVNITRGKGGLPAGYTDEDFVRAVQHCVRPDGSTLLFMPCEETRLIPEGELAGILAWVKQMPPVDRVMPDHDLTMLAHVLHAAGVMELVSLAKFDLNEPVPAAPPRGPTAAFGQRLAQIQCVGCHGDNLSGGPLPGAPPSLPVPTNLTPDQASGLGKWSRDQFVTLMRTGKRPDGTDVNPFMPWSVYKHLDDEEMDAIWAYLQSTPKRPFGNR